MLAACTWFQWFYRAFVFFFCCCCGFLNIHTTKYYLLCFDIRFPGFVKSDFSHRFYSAANRIVARINRMKQDTASRHHQNSWPNCRAPFLPFLIFFFLFVTCFILFFLSRDDLSQPPNHTQTHFIMTLYFSWLEREQNSHLLSWFHNANSFVKKNKNWKQQKKEIDV